MAELFTITGLGYLTAFSGLLLGAVFAMVFKNLKAVFYSLVMGFSAGLLIAFVCFSMLPVSFDAKGVYFSVLSILAGVFVCYLIEFKVEKMKRKEHKLVKSTLLLALAVSIHNLPEGMSLGSLYSNSVAKGLSMAIIIAVHCFPEAIAIFVPMKHENISNKTIIFYALLLAVPMALGALSGAVITGAFLGFDALVLSFSGGIMLYVACGEIIPESKQIYSGGLSSLGAMAGFVSGILLVL